MQLQFTTCMQCSCKHFKIMCCHHHWPTEIYLFRIFLLVSGEGSTVYFNFIIFVTNNLKKIHKNVGDCGIIRILSVLRMSVLKNPFGNSVDYSGTKKRSGNYKYTCVYFVCFWSNSPQWARASSFTRFLDHTQRHTTVGMSPLDEWSARGRDLYLTTHTKLTTDSHSCPIWDSNPQSQQESSRRPTP